MRERRAINRTWIGNLKTKVKRYEPSEFVASAVLITLIVLGFLLGS